MTNIDHRGRDLVIIPNEEMLRLPTPELLQVNYQIYKMEIPRFELRGTVGFLPSRLSGFSEGVESPLWPRHLETWRRDRDLYGAPFGRVLPDAVIGKLPIDRITGGSCLHIPC
jgi:hypothetical protein